MSKDNSGSKTGRSSNGGGHTGGGRVIISTQDKGR